MFSRRLDGCTGDAAVVAAVGKAAWNDTDEALYLHRISVGDDVAGLDPKAQRYEPRTSGPGEVETGDSGNRTSDGASRGDLIPVVSIDEPLV